MRCHEAWPLLPVKPAEAEVTQKAWAILTTMFLVLWQWLGRFGDRAKQIKNRAVVNEEMSVVELKLLLEKAQAEIAQLKAMVNVRIYMWRCSVYMCVNIFVCMQVRICVDV